MPESDRPADALPPKRPFITANQLTFLRLALIPIPCWMLYQGTRGQLYAIVTATILGCTDFVDGYLARKYGATVLGALMDPIADKVFIAITYLPSLTLIAISPSMVGIIFVREFLVTAARTCYERRSLSLKSSYLARYKTWVQMCGIALLFLLQILEEPTMHNIFVVMAVLPLILFAARFVMTRKRWKGASAFAVSGAGLLVAHEILGSGRMFFALLYFIVAVTVFSGLGYLSNIGQLRGLGRITVGEIVRLLASVAFPCLAMAAEMNGHAATWAIIALVSLELAHGGLDNLLAHHHVESGAGEWSLRMGSECTLLMVAIYDAKWAYVASLAALVVALVGLSRVAYAKRRYYLDDLVESKVKPQALLA